MARDAGSYDNGIDDSEVNSYSKTLYTDDTVFADTDNEATSGLEGLEQIMEDYQNLRKLYEDLLTEKNGLSEKHRQAREQTAPRIVVVPDESCLDGMIKEIDEKEREMMRLKIQNEVLKRELRETEDDLVYAIDKLEESQKEKTYLDDKIVRWVKGSLIATGNYGYTNLLNSLAKPISKERVIFHSGGMLEERPDDRSKGKEKISMEDYQLGEVCQASTSKLTYADRDDLSDAEVEPYNAEIEKRKRGAANNIPPPKSYNTAIVSAWKRKIQHQSVENKRKIDQRQRDTRYLGRTKDTGSQPWKKMEKASRQPANPKSKPARGQHGNHTVPRNNILRPAQYEKRNNILRPAQYGKRSTKLKPAQYGERNHILRPAQYGGRNNILRPAQYGKGNIILNSTQYDRPQYRRNEDRSGRGQHQRFYNQRWPRHSFQGPPQPRRNDYQTDLHQPSFTKRGTKEMKKNGARATSTQQRRNQPQPSSRFVRQIWVPKGTTNLKGPKH